MDIFLSADAWLGLVTLTVLEIVLGVDNIIFISIISDKLPPEQRSKARRVGLALALITRILLLFSLSWMVKLTEPVFTLVREFSGRDLILLVGGLFLIYKATHEIHGKLEGEDGEKTPKGAVSFGRVIGQIMILDIVFSLDSVITAVGMVDHFLIMVIAVVIAVAIMLLLVNQLADYVDRHPTIKMLALSFLLLIGFSLVGEGTGMHIPKGYIYFAMGFSVGVEMLNQFARRGKNKVELHQPYR
ncbi:MAG: TerC family protein [Acidobacteria bacterium]|nr:TerC family protein [Acidobacteriota bacterium]MCB9399600.1 TerC family protein [Acidobacteriota bacterium]